MNSPAQEPTHDLEHASRCVARRCLLSAARSAARTSRSQPKSTVTERQRLQRSELVPGLHREGLWGLAVSGQQGPAGRPTSRASTKDSRSTCACSGSAGAADRRSRDRLERRRSARDEHADLGRRPTASWSRCTTAIFYQVGMANEFLRQTTDAKLAERGERERGAQRRDHARIAPRRASSAR